MTDEHILPTGASVTVHKGWDIPSTRRKTPPKLRTDQLTGLESSPSIQEPAGLGSQPLAIPVRQRHFAFVNAVEPGRNKDPEVRKLVRSHVRNEHVRNTARAGNRHPKRPSPSPGTVLSHRSQNTKPSTAYEPVITDMVLKDSQTIPLNIGYPTALHNYDFPIEMEPHTHTFLSQYLAEAPRRFYSLESFLKSNPLRSQEWFHFAVQDAAMLHGVLYAGALYLALLEGKRETADTVFHLLAVVSIVNKRLGESGRLIDDASIGAVSCLALGEALVGNEDLWKTHMLGIKRMIQSRSTIHPLPSMLQNKLYRSDITGAIDFAATPFLNFSSTSNQPVWSILPPEDSTIISSTMEILLTNSGIHAYLKTTMTKLANFAQAIHHASSTSILLDPSSFADDLYHLEHEFLSFPANTPFESEETSIDKACRLGALLYMKAILQEFPHSYMGPSILLQQLQNALEDIAVQGGMDNPLVLWLALVGGSFATGDMRRWFVGYLAQVKAVMGLESFGNGSLGMSGFLGLKSVFGAVFEGLGVLLRFIVARTQITQHKMGQCLSANPVSSACISVRTPSRPRRKTRRPCSRRNRLRKHTASLTIIASETEQLQNSRSRYDDEFHIEDVQSLYDTEKLCAQLGLPSVLPAVDDNKEILGRQNGGERAEDGEKRLSSWIPPLSWKCLEPVKVVNGDKEVGARSTERKGSAWEEEFAERRLSSWTPPLSWDCLTPTQPNIKFPSEGELTGKGMEFETSCVGYPDRWRCLTGIGFPDVPSPKVVENSSAHQEEAAINNSPMTFEAELKDSSWIQEQVVVTVDDDKASSVLLAEEEQEEKKQRRKEVEDAAVHEERSSNLAMAKIPSSPLPKSENLKKTKEPAGVEEGSTRSKDEQFFEQMIRLRKRRFSGARVSGEE
ncbi:hypothetical protein G7Y89_g8478 [Cudoniella acicularis]|uniref:Uncharacterized protein n=1 Tax=Cudoniella acicularis TaxID=354080 RepID=A0A8H4W0K6_9HELO|nr:hypothetical protein G7Y89_g8478 [Cudoniella acicularis]